MLKSCETVRAPEETADTMIPVYPIIAAALLLAGCSFTNVVTKGSSDITIEYAPGNYDAAVADAEAHCASYGKKILHSGTSCPKDNRCLSNFDCVEDE